jgi:hypothetical protein
MTKKIGITLALMLAVALPALARGAAQDANATLDKAIQALGGQEKLDRAKAVSWTSKGTITFMGTDNPMTIRSTVQGLDHLRQDFDGEFGGMQIKGVSVMAGEKGWRVVAGQKTELDKSSLADQKRLLYVDVVPVTIVALKGSGFKTEPIAEIKVGDKPAVGLKVTAPDGKDFSLYFDKESGLPVRLVAKVTGFDGQPFNQETTYSDYQDMGGIKKATKISSKRDGEKFIEEQITEFKVLDQVEPKAFDEPQ